MIAYIYVEDAAGEMVAHQPRDLPLYLLRDFPKSAERALKGIEVDYRGLPVYELSMRVAEGKGGYVHLALWRDAFDEETRRVLTPIAASTIILLAGVTGAFAWAMWNLVNPFITLVDRADRINKFSSISTWALKRLMRSAISLDRSTGCAPVCTRCSRDWKPTSLPSSRASKTAKLPASITFLLWTRNAALICAARIHHFSLDLDVGGQFNPMRPVRD